MAETGDKDLAGSLIRGTVTMRSQNLMVLL